MNKLFTILIIALATSVQAQCLISFNPVNSGDELTIVGQGIDTAINQDASLDFNGIGSIEFNYSGSNGSSFSYNCGSSSYNSGLINDGFQYFENAALPVELTFFKGEVVDNTTFLEWQTSSEDKNSHFEVERSTNGINFEKIGYVTGHGNSVVINDYIFIDYESKSGANYYRLKQVDFDGQFEYSDFVFVNSKNESDVKVFGNVVENELRLTGEGSAYITNNYGQVVRQLQLTESNIATVDVSTLAKGIYYIKLKNETLRFVKL